MRLIRRALYAMLDLLAPRNYMLRRAHDHVVLMSEITCHLMEARARLYNAVNNSIASGMPLVMSDTPAPIVLLNGYKLFISYDPESLATIKVSLGADFTDYEFETAVWKMLRASTFLCATGTTTESVEVMGLRVCRVAGVDTATRAKHVSAMRQVGDKLFEEPE